MTFEGLLESTPFLARIRALLRLLREKTRGPVDIEFASDGQDLYLLQCRPQSFSRRRCACRDPERPPGREGRLRGAAVRLERSRSRPDARRLRRPGRATRTSPTRRHSSASDQAVGRLNKVLPKRQFVLMGPGRWGSRGDYRLGVPVTYSDINNTAVLVEIARKARQLRAGPLVRDALLPGPRRGVDPVRAALPRRSRNPLPRRRSSSSSPERPRRPRARFSRPRRRRPRHRRPEGRPAGPSCVSS